MQVQCCKFIECVFAVTFDRICSGSFTARKNKFQLINMTDSVNYHMHPSEGIIDGLSEFLRSVDRLN